MMTQKEQMRAQVGEAARSLRDERGTAVVEFAVLLLPLALILFGILDFGRAMNYKNHLTQLANEVARFAVVNRDPRGVTAGNPTGKFSTMSCADLKAYLQARADTNELDPLLGAANTIQISLPNGSSNVGDPIAVNVKVAFPWLSFISTETLNGKAATTLRGEATMRLEQQLAGTPGSC